MSLKKLKSQGFVLPYLGWLMAFLVAPLLFVVVTSFMRKGVWGGIVFEFNIQNFVRAFDPLYLHVLWQSVKLATFTAFSCLIIGYPMAWYMTKLSPRHKKLALIAVMLPFMSNFVVRAYAVKFVMGVEGPLNQFLMSSQWIDRPLFLDSPSLAIWLGMVTNYLPFLVLPLFVALDRFDRSLIEAARDLGASPLKIWHEILWPLTRKPAWTGFSLVFVPALGEFVIPDLMGGGRAMFFGNLLAEQFLKSRDWPFGSAVFVLMFSLCVAAVVFWYGLRQVFSKAHGPRQAVP